MTIKDVIAPRLSPSSLTRQLLLVRLYDGVLVTQQGKQALHHRAGRVCLFFSHKISLPQLLGTGGSFFNYRVRAPRVWHCC